MENTPAEENNTSQPQEDDCDSHFEIDTLWECDTNPNFKGRIDAPTYDNSFSSVLQEPGAEVTYNAKSAPPRNNCFNCMGQHLINECPHPRDQRAITKNRREFMNKNSGFFRQVSRYHLGEDQMYAHMVPGQISKELRQALGLSKKQLPLHVYRMRLFGYPPGWLEDARISRSGIALYADSKEVPTPGDEEGEIVTDGSKDTYDVTKIHDFPGFNVPPEPDTIDESRFYQCPSQLREQSKDVMIKNLESQRAAATSYKKLASIPMLSNTEENIVDGNEDPNSNSTPDPQSDLSREASVQENRCPSPSLEDLEAQKKSLMAALLIKSAAAELMSSSNDIDIVENSEQGTVSSERSDEDSVSVSKHIPPLAQDETNTLSSGSDVGSPLASTNMDCATNNESIVATSDKCDGDQLCTPKNTGSVRHVEIGSSVSERVTPYSRTSTPQGTKIGTVKQIEQGTPILKSASPFSYLPSPDNFSKGICDVINFENLPDALGHYKRMNEVIHSVRNHLKRQ